MNPADIMTILGLTLVWLFSAALAILLEYGTLNRHAPPARAVTLTFLAGGPVMLLVQLVALLMLGGETPPQQSAGEIDAAVQGWQQQLEKEKAGLALHSPEDSTLLQPIDFIQANEAWPGRCYFCGAGPAQFGRSDTRQLDVDFGKPTCPRCLRQLIWDGAMVMSRRQHAAAAPDSLKSRGR